MSKARTFILILLLVVVAALSWYLRVPDNINYRTLAESQYIEIDGFNVHYVEEGQGQNLLLVHGFAASTYSWYKVWPLLKNRFHVTALDLPGFGLSDKPRSRSYTLDEQAERLSQFIEAKNLAPVYIIGWSMGAEISLWLAKQKPHLITKLVLITPALNSEIIKFPVSLAEWTAPALADWIVTPQAVKLTFWRVFEKPVADKDNFALQAYYPYHQSPDAYYSLISGMKVIADKRNPDAFTNIQTPFRLLLSEKDKVIPMHLYEAFKKMYPNADIHIHPSGGHGLMTDEPEWVATKSLEFFEDH